MSGSRIGLYCVYLRIGQRYIKKPYKMRVDIINKDIEKLEKALKLIEKTECYGLYNKSVLIFEVCESIGVLKDKVYRIEEFKNSSPSESKCNSLNMALVKLDNFKAGDSAAESKSTK